VYGVNFLINILKLSLNLIFLRDIAMQLILLITQ